MYPTVRIASLTNSFLLRVLFHSALDPSTCRCSLFFHFLRAHLGLIKGRVPVGHMTALLEAGPLEELIQPSLQVWELVNINPRPIWTFLLARSRQGLNLR